VRKRSARKKENAPTEADFSGLGRRKLRYWCFRFQTEVEGGAVAEGAPAGLRSMIEAKPGFEGWRRFAKTWDLASGPEIVIVVRTSSVWQEWSETLNRVALQLPVAPETPGRPSGSYGRQSNV